MKGLGVNLLKTIGLSIVISTVLNVSYYLLVKKSEGYHSMHVIFLIMAGTLYINAILAVMAIPSLFLSCKNYWDNKITRLLLYFSGPVLLLVSALFMSTKPSDTVIYLITAIVFLSVHAIFYNHLSKYKHT